VRALFSRLLCRAPSERFASAAEVENRLHKLLLERQDYGHAEAAAELHQALVEAGEAVAADAEPGMGRVLHPDAVSTEPSAPGA